VCNKSGGENDDADDDDDDDDYHDDDDGDLGVYKISSKFSVVQSGNGYKKRANLRIYGATLENI
jgi:hypothetical protein